MTVATQPEQVRLVIWDLDDTFWSGTLTEGGVRYNERNIAIVRELASRGIMNSICSKNDSERASQELERCGVFDYFIFPRIAWKPKGAMVRSIVDASQLRPETIILIDDNPINLNEVHHSNPGLQLAGPELLEGMLSDSRFVGKDDRGLTRLKQYKLLEAKEADRTDAANDAGSEFLSQSDIQISFHHDIAENIARIHELINRSNQLNFTKRRLPEDRREALAEIENEFRAGLQTHAAYVKVSDKYGAYGIVGFYLISRPKTRAAPHLRHFVFSCRILNMGIEQFVFHKLSPVKLDIVGEVVSQPRAPSPIDWIRVVADAERRETTGPTRPVHLCMRGACEFAQLTHYLGHRFAVTRESAFPYRGWGVAVQAAQFASIFDDLQKPEHQALMQRLPSLHPRIMESCVLSLDADVYILSFTMEKKWSHFRYRETGIVIPMKLQQGAAISAADLLAMSYDRMREVTSIDFTEPEWNWFQGSFEYVNGFDPLRFAQNVQDLLIRLRGKPVIIVLENTQHARDRLNLTTNTEMAEITKLAAARFEPILVSFDDLITRPSEALTESHYRREVYARLAKKIADIIDALPSSGAGPSAIMGLSGATV